MLKSEEEIKCKNLIMEGIQESYGETLNMLHERVTGALNQIYDFNDCANQIPKDHCYRMGPSRKNARRAIVRSNLDTHLSDTPFAIQQPIWRPRLLERVYKPIRTPHWCRVLQSSITESIRDRV